MDEKERRDAEEPEEISQAAAEDSDAAQQEEDAPEEGERLYFGRFTAGVWRGGVLGIAFGYILLGVFGMINHHFALGLDKILESSIFKYGLIIVLCYASGKLGGTLEKRRKEEQQD